MLMDFVAKKAKRRRGRPAIGKGVLIGVRLRPQHIAALDAWRRQEDEGRISRPEAVRRLMLKGLFPERERK
jgi:hypothetical protein